MSCLQEFHTECHVERKGGGWVGGWGGGGGGGGGTVICWVKL